MSWFFFSSRRRHTRLQGDWSSDVCSSDLCEIPEAYGGLGLSCLAQGLLVEEISYGCVAVNLSIGGNGLGIMPLLVAGSEEQKREYFGRLLAAPVFMAYACSEPDAGSDVAGMRS